MIVAKNLGPLDSAAWAAARRAVAATGARLVVLDRTTYYGSARGFVRPHRPSVASGAAMSLSARLRHLEQRFGVRVPEVSVVIAFRKSASQVADELAAAEVRASRARAEAAR